MKKQFNRNNVKVNPQNRKSGSTKRPGAKARQVKFNPSLFEYIDRDTIARIHDRDYPTVVGEDRDSNVNNLYVMLNTWFNFIVDLGVDAKHIVNAILLYGIKNTLKDLEDYRHAALSSEPLPKYSWLVFLASLPIDKVSMICGFPKRTLIISGTHYEYWSDFKASNRMMEDRCYSNYLVSQLREKMDILIKGYRRDFSKFIIAPGATVEGASTYYEKWLEIKKKFTFLRMMGVNLPVFDPFHKVTVDDVPPRYCEYTTVPKNAFKRRGIAKESVVKQVVAYQIDAGLRQLLLSHGIDLSDQERNQFAAFIGSLPAIVDNDVIDQHPLSRKYPEMAALGKSGVRVATVDLSAASDSIRAILVSDIVYGLLYDEMFYVRSRFVEFRDDKRHESIKSHRWSTMGSAITFVLETIIFRAIKMLAYDYYNLFSEETVEMTALDTDYGDDSTIDVRVAETYMSLLECFGFQVNRDKTYYTGSYRESCGAEYLNGKDVTINFYPRGTSRYELPELVSLQHKLQPYARANGFLVECIRQLCPSITESGVGSDHDDIWSERYVRVPRRSSWYSLPRKSYSIKWSIVETYRPLSLRGRRRFDNELDEKLWKDFRVLRKEKFIYWRRIPRQYATISEAIEAKDRLWELFQSWYKTDQDKRLVSVFEEEEEYVSTRLDVIEHPDITEHTCFSVNLRPVPKEQEDECELLMYLLTIGSGIEHVNNSPFTDPRDFIRDRRSLTAKGQFQITTSISFD